MGRTQRQLKDSVWSSLATGMTERGNAKKNIQSEEYGDRWLVSASHLAMVSYNSA
jgi:hypothetical protein